MIPRCEHGNIILGCPDTTCEDQLQYLEEQQVAMLRWEAMQQEAARVYVRTLLGLPL